MSFRGLKDEIYLVLLIKAGHGFGFATSPLVVTANLAGNVHESFITEPCPQPKFENEFVWVMDKTKLKSIWSDKVPVRVECFSVDHLHRSRIGYIILNVKDAQIVQDEGKITEKQIRLLGLSKDVALLKPELILSFYITDIPIQSPQVIPQFHPPLEGRQAHMSDGPLKVTLGSGRDHYNLSISVVAVNDLRELLPSHSEVEPNLLTYTYGLMGAEIVSEVSSNHSVQLALISSLACLKTYFVRQPMVMVKLHMGTLLVGQTNINMEKLLLYEELNLKRTKQYSRTMTCHCLIDQTHHLSETWADFRPSVDFSISFTSEAPVLKKRSEITAFSRSSVGAGGDADNNSSLVLPLEPPVTAPLMTQQQTAHKTNDGGGGTYRKESQTDIGGGETYRTPPQTGDDVVETCCTQASATNFTITVVVTRLHLEQPLPPQAWLRLRHTCASVTPQHEVSVPVSWAPLHWHLSVALPRHLLESSLTAQPGSLQLGIGDQVVAAASLLPPDTIPTSLMKQCEHIVVLEKDGVKVAESGVVWAVAESASESAATFTDLSLSPPVQPQTVRNGIGPDVLSPRSRELKILSFVEELEDWAEKQRIIVMEGLKEEEAARLASLQAQWEAEVGGQVSEGRQLVDALHNMRDQLKRQESELRDNQYKMKVYKEELERVHRNKLQEFKDLSRRMQDEFNHKLALIASDKVALEHEVQELREANGELKRRIKEMENTAEADKRLADSCNHELKILKEKLSMEQESKKFFKEHCRKAEQEIHRLNVLRQQELEARLHSEKKSLEQLALQQIIVERNDLRQDQRLLDEIRQQLLNRADIDSNCSGGTVHTDGRLFTEERHIRRAT